MEAVSALFQTNTPTEQIVIRLLVASGLGMLLGLDRELRNKAAGLRTHMLVSLATASFAIIAVELYLEVKEIGSPDSISADPIRLIEGVTAGVAFLAAGTIIRSGQDVHGLTTGASIWLTGAIGLACGGGLFTIAAVTALFALPILYLLTRFEAWLHRHRDDASGRTPE